MFAGVSIDPGGRSSRGRSFQAAAGRGAGVVPGCTQALAHQLCGCHYQPIGLSPPLGDWIYADKDGVLVSPEELKL